MHIPLHDHTINRTPNCAQRYLRRRAIQFQVSQPTVAKLGLGMTLASAQDQMEIAKRGLKSAVSEQELAGERFSVLSSASNFELTNALFSLARARDNAIEALYRLMPHGFI